MFEQIVRTHKSPLEVLVSEHMLSCMASRRAAFRLAAGVLLGANLGCGTAEVVAADAGTGIPKPTCTDGIPAAEDRTPTWAGYLFKGTVSGALAVDATDLYFYSRGTRQYGLWAVAKRGGQPRLLVDGVTPGSLVSDGPWLHVDGGRRKKADPTVFYPYPENGEYAGHDTTHFYLVVRGDKTYRLEKVSKTNDADRTVLADRVSPEARLAVGHVVWPTPYSPYSTSSDTVFERVSTKGGAVERLELPSGSLVAADCNYLYFSGREGAWRIAQGGSEPTVLGNIPKGSSWAIDAAGLYTFVGERLVRLSLRSGEIARVAEDKLALSGASLALDDTTVYFGTQVGIARVTK